MVRKPKIQGPGVSGPEPDHAAIRRTVERVFLDAGESAPSCSAVLAGFLQELRLWNRRLRLTGMKTEDDLAERGVYASSRVARHLGGGDSVVDVGSGNGFPGLVLAALVPRARFTLVEKSPARAAFLKTAAARMAMGNVEVLAGRAEDLAGRRTFDAAVSMAVLRPAAWLELGSRLVGPGGRVFLLHAGRGELPAGTGGLVLVADDGFSLPWSRHRRAVAVYRRDSTAG